MLDFQKLKAQSSIIAERAKAERLETLNEIIHGEIINLLKNNVIVDELVTFKVRIETKQSSRVINNWEKEGIIDKEFEEEGKWRKFSKVDSVWISVISELREFGLSLEKIKLVKKQLFSSKIKGFRPIEYAIVHSIMLEPIVLLVYSNGELSMISQSQFYERSRENAPLSHLYINLASFLKKEFPANKFDVLSATPGYQLTDNELKLLYFLRTGDYQYIKVNLKNGDIYMLEANRKIDTKSKIVEILKSGDYQDIEIKTQASNIVSIQTTHKIKF